MEKNIITRRIQEDLKKAVKDRDKERTSTLRMLISSLKSAEKDLLEELDEEKEIEILGSYARKCRESLEGFEKGGRDDLIEKCRNELDLVAAYLPEQLDEDSIREEIRKVIADTGAQGPRDMGKVMGMMMKKFKGQVDGSVVKDIASELLGG